MGKSKKAKKFKPSKVQVIHTTTTLMIENISDPSYHDDVRTLLDSKSEPDEEGIIQKIHLFVTANKTHRHNDIQVLKETLTSAIQSVYDVALNQLRADISLIQKGHVTFVDDQTIPDNKILQQALNKVIHMDESKEIYHIAFVQVNRFVDQIIAIVRSLEGDNSELLIPVVTRAWNLTKSAASKLNSFLYLLFESEIQDSGITCIGMNRQILVEKLRKEPIILELSSKESEADDMSGSGDISDEELASTDVSFNYGAEMEIDEIISLIEEPKKRRGAKKKRHKKRKLEEQTLKKYIEEFRMRLEAVPTPTKRLKPRLALNWVQQLLEKVARNHSGVD